MDNLLVWGNYPTMHFLQFSTSLEDTIQLCAYCKLQIHIFETSFTKNLQFQAAHCINGIPTMTVFGGHVQWHTHEEFVERATPENFIVHENWRAHLPHLHNVGLIRLFTTTPALFDGPFVKQIALPTLPSDQTNSFEGFTIRAMGFGTGHRLRSGLTRVISNQECSQQNIETIWSGNLCVTHTDDMNPCRHDDGSPGVVNRNGEDVVLAIFSIGRDDCNVGSPAIYVRVTSYLDWIHHHINM